MAELITKLKVEIDKSQIDGMSDLISAAQEFVARVESGEVRSKHSYGRFKKALDDLKAAEIPDAAVLFKADSEPTPFYHMNGIPSTPPDIDEDLGQLLLAVEKGLDFIHEGPALNATENVIASMYDSYVVKLIPKLKTIIANRIMVKYSFAELVDMTQSGASGRRNELQKMINMAESIDLMAMGMHEVLEEYKTGDVIADKMINRLALIALNMQSIMNTFGWTWDDVKLKGRLIMEKGLIVDLDNPIH